MRDLSDITIGDDGISKKTVKVPCPTCKRKGTVNDHKYFGKAISYYDRNGNRCPQEKCRTCNGEGWVDVPVSEIIKTSK